MPHRPDDSRRPPLWLRKRVAAGSDTSNVSNMLDELGLATVCSGARCPNLPECYARGTATFLILGSRCTRRCAFCAMGSAESREPLSPPDPLEPENVAEAAARLGLKHVVITSVTRDDLPDGGAASFYFTIDAVRSRLPQATIEVLTPDFLGNRRALKIVLDAHPHVFNHNIETVPRLYSTVRPQADYARSLEVLRRARDYADSRRLPLRVKSGFMVGLGETDDEVAQAMRDLRKAGCDMLTIGQYLAPTPNHLPVVRHVEPKEYDAWRDAAKEMGFTAVAAGPFVRSSYRAEEAVHSEADSR
ncbi:lipoyl synthase [Candidatus Sumerlaeota bacterium]|nr:lipoyl synthase [Candidatus Sumerlaeota bacterium]